MTLTTAPDTATITDLINATRTLLTGGLHTTRNRLNAAINNTTTSVTLEFDTTGISRDARIEIDNELMYVWDVDHTTNTLTVERGYDGTTAASHSAGDAVTVDPPFTRSAIRGALHAEIDRLNGSGLFAYDTLTLDVEDGEHKVDLDGVETTILDVYSVTVDDDGDRGPKPVQFRFYRDRDTGDYGSGFALQLLTDVDGDSIRVVYTHEFDSFSDDGDVVTTTCGVPAEAVPALPYGAAWRLMIQKEALRAQVEAQPASRRAEEVQQQSLAFVAEQFARQRDQMVSDALAMQQRRYPARIQR